MKFKKCKNFYFECSKRRNGYNLEKLFLLTSFLLNKNHQKLYYKGSIKYNYQDKNGI